MANVAQVEIEKDEVGWILRVTNPGTRPQEYRCSTREQAQALADVMTGVRQAGSRGAGGSSSPAK